MPTLPNGTTVTIQQTEGWNYDPPPIVQLAVSVTPAEIKPGESVTVTSTLLDDSNNPIEGNDIVVQVVEPDATSNQETIQTDANGEVSTTKGPYETPGTYEVKASGSGFTLATVENWEQ